MERPLFWHQGLFLQPQHFQLEDRYLQDLFKPIYKFLHPHLWGAGDLEIAGEALDSGVVSLFKGEFLFQDTSYVRFPGNALCQARSFEDAWAMRAGRSPYTPGLRNGRARAKMSPCWKNFDDLATVTTRFVTAADPEEIQDMPPGWARCPGEKTFLRAEAFCRNRKRAAR